MKWLLPPTTPFGFRTTCENEIEKNCIDAINQMVMCQSIIIVCGCLFGLKGEQGLQGYVAVQSS